MEKFQVDPNNDISKEKYQGPGPVLASAGYMYVSHLLSMFAGFVGLGTLGAMNTDRTHALKQWSEKLSSSHTESNNSVKRGFAKAVAWISNTAEDAAHKFLGGIQKVSGSRLQAKPMSEQRTAAFLFAGSLGIVLGYVGSSIWGIAKGRHDGNKGKHQFERAKAEILDLRERNENLEKINDKLHGEMVEEATKWKSVASAAKAENAAPSTTLNAAQHDGTVQPQQEIAATPA